MYHFFIKNIFSYSPQRQTATTTEMKVVVFESFGNQDPLANADVKLLEIQSPGSTERFAAAQTDSRGVATLRVPNNQQQFILTASKRDYLETAKRYNSRPSEGKNTQKHSPSKTSHLQKYQLNSKNCNLHPFDKSIHVFKLYGKFHVYRIALLDYQLI